MYVIALSGKENSGKSQTLNIVFNLLLLDGYKQVENLPPPFRRKSLGTVEQKDFTDVVQKNGKIIGIATMGDYYSKPGHNNPDTIKSLLRALFDAGCTTAICACREDEAVNREELADFPNIIFKKSTSNEQWEQWIKNNSDAQSIFNHI
jgi:hypothetical protein